jgi:hypothetical protein
MSIRERKDLRVPQFLEELPVYFVERGMPASREQSARRDVLWGVRSLADLSERLVTYPPAPYPKRWPGRV